ncbi:MAG: hypothetical protein HFJ27_05615 [Clostridia bacterium]|nr:hypothetical protein [Clostridia bacterium]
MKKWMYIVLIAIIMVIAIIIGIYLFKNEDTPKTENRNVLSTNQTLNLIDEEEQENTILNEISVSSNETEKISPNAVLILKKQYEECAHTIKEYARIPEEYVNLTKEELGEKQSDWEVEAFSPNEVILIKEASGVCNQHYVLRQKDGVIAIYQIGKDNSETLKEETSISVEYLTQTDKLRLEEGIRIYGEEELNSTLEDYE